MNVRPHPTMEREDNDSDDADLSESLSDPAEGQRALHNYPDPPPLKKHQKKRV